MKEKEREGKKETEKKERRGGKMRKKSSNAGIEPATS